MATHLSLDEMKHKVRQHFEEFVNHGDLDAIRRNMTKDFVDHDGPGGEAVGTDGDATLMATMRKMGPDLQVTIEDMIGEGDKIVCRNVWRWTHPVSGRRMGFQGFVLWRFEGERIAERWATVTSPAEIKS